VETAARSAFLSSLLLLLLFFVTVLFRIGALPLTGADEPRYARVAEEMWRAGRWVTPSLEGRPWLEKPPLYYWITIPHYAVLGPTETAARLGPAFCLLISSLTVWWLGRRLLNPLAGLYAGTILLTAVGFVAFGRSASTDMPFVACLTVSLALFCFATINTGGVAWALLGGYTFLGLAVLAKGPVTVVLVIGTLSLFWWLDEHGGAIRRLRIMPGFLIVAAVALPWFVLAFRENGFAFISVFFINHNLMRYVTGLHHHAEPFYYYVPVLFGLLFPWSGWLPLMAHGIHRGRLSPRQEWNRTQLFLVCWFIFPLIFFSISESKLSGYILPSLPAAALLLGNRLSAVHRDRLFAFALWFNLGVSVTIAAALVAVFQIRYGGRWQTGLLLAVMALLPALTVSWRGLRGRVKLLVPLTLFQGLILIMGATQFAFPVLGAYHSTRDIARQALAVREGSEPIVTYLFFHHTLSYYTDYQITGDLKEPQAVSRFAQSNPSFLLLTEEHRVGDIYGLEGLTVSAKGTQGKLHLFRLSRSLEAQRQD
jgi:4-amino-4-deoxy-L-arabinose transferase-like glycosyltransferase